MIYETANAYYFRSILAIGGIESHLFYIARKYGRYDITVFYRDADPVQLRRLKQYVRCVQLRPHDKVVCDKLFCCFNREILDQCEAGTKYLVLHGDYLDMVKRGQMTEGNLPKDPRIDKYLGVSQHVCDTWEKLTGIKAYRIGEPVVLDDDRPLQFISATRLSAEKGWGRMKILADALDKAGVRYDWYVYTNSPKTGTYSKNIRFREPRIDISGLFPMFDAYIQLSDNEGYCLSVVEALLQGVPVIVTDCPVFHEIGVTEANGVILQHSMEDLPIGEIRDIRTKVFTYKQPTDNWSRYLSKKKAVYSSKFYRVMATDAWIVLRLLDSQTGTIHQPGDIWEVSEDRLSELLGYEKTVKMTLIEVLKE